MLRFTNNRIVVFILLCFLLAANKLSLAQFYTGSQMEFGKNRMKYENFFWTYYAYDRYDVYFYEEGKDLANYVSKVAKKEVESIERLFDYAMEERFQFIVFNKHSDFKQSNIGLSNDEQYNIGGVTRIAGTKIILYYEGDHSKLDEQIREGITQVLVDEMMYGGSLRQMVKNNTLLNLPDWYLKGLVSYVAKDWNSDIDNRVKDGVLNRRYNNINYLTGDDAIYAGHAFWKHVANNYGETTISNMLYMTRISRNIDNSALFVLGIPLRTLWNECLEFYGYKYNDDKNRKMPEQAPILKRPKSSRTYAQLKVSPDGSKVIYTTNELGQYKIWLYDFNTKQTQRILKAEHKLDRINDYSYPLLAWHPSGKLFSYIIERRGFVVLQTYELQTGAITERNITGFEKILDYSYSDDGKKFVMSAVQKGQTDIFVFTAASSAYYQVTKDIYDDLHPRFANNSSRIVFASNRPGDTLYFDPKRKYADKQNFKDIYAFDYLRKSPVLARVTNTRNFDESYPTDYDSTHVSFLSDMNGVRNRYIAAFDSTLAYVDTIAHYKTIVSSFPVTNYSRNVLEQNIDVKSGKISEVFYRNGKYRMYISPKPEAAKLTPIQLTNTSYRDYKISVEKKQEKESQEKEQKIDLTPTISNVKQLSNNESPKSKDSTEIDINNYVFENETPKPTYTETPSATQNTVSTDTAAVSTPSGKDEFQLAKQQNYNTAYSIDYVVTQLDNSFLNRSYQKFTGGGGPVFLNSGVNGLMKVGISDLFEDYRITAGVRFSGEITNNEYFLSYEDRMYNLDKQLVLHRQSLQTLDADRNVVKIHTHDARYSVSLPFSEVASVRGAVTYRNDRTIYLSVSDANLARRSKYDNWASTLVQYVYDNTLKQGLNLYNGFRGKAFAEYYKQVGKPKTDFFVLGLDARYYLKIHRDLVWANRLAASTSFGSQKLVYYMGGVDNWFIPKFDNTINISQTNGYAYQTLATNMRGFYQNARNGNTFAVINSELRLPIIKYFARKPIRSDFAQNFQLIVFGDVGTAWTGYSPLEEKNSFNTRIIGTNKTPYLITLTTQHDPLIGGYGWGMRSRIFGYFVRLDRAWGVQDGIVLKPMTYISLGLDF